MKKKTELMKLKDECAKNEDYDGAGHYKRQLEILEDNYKKDVARIESGMPVEQVFISCNLIHFSFFLVFVSLEVSSFFWV